MAHFDALRFRVNHPGDADATAEKILKTLIDLSACIVFGEDFDCQIGRAGKESPFTCRLEEFGASGNDATHESFSICRGYIFSGIDPGGELRVVR